MKNNAIKHIIVISKQIPMYLTKISPSYDDKLRECIFSHYEI